MILAGKIVMYSILYVPRSDNRNNTYYYLLQHYMYGCADVVHMPLHHFIFGNLGQGKCFFICAYYYQSKDIR